MLEGVVSRNTGDSTEGNPKEEKTGQGCFFCCRLMNKRLKATE